MKGWNLGGFADRQQRASQKTQRIRHNFCTKMEISYLKLGEQQRKLIYRENYKKRGITFRKVVVLGKALVRIKCHNQNMLKAIDYCLFLSRGYQSYSWNA